MGMTIVKKALPKANMKLTGTRILVLVFDIQQQVLNVFIVGESLYKLVEKHQDRLPLGFDIHTCEFHPEQSQLFNLTLLNFECLFVVIFNLAAWWDLDLEKAGFHRFPSSSTVLPNVSAQRLEPANSVEFPLLGAEDEDEDEEGNTEKPTCGSLRSLMPR